VITFTAYGIAATQGSLRGFIPKGWKRPILTSDNKRLRPWRQAVVDSCREIVAGRCPMEGPVHLDVTFFLPRPKTAPKRITEPAKLPDLSKLVRALEDALTSAGVWRDDAQVIHVEARKAVAAGIHDPEGAAWIPGAVVTAYEVPHQQPEQDRQRGLLDIAEARS